jgi:hypothetical protein
MTNTLAYYGTELIATVKNFMTPPNNKLPCLSFSAKTKMEMNDNDKHSSLLQNMINYNRIRFMIPPPKKQ